MGAGKGWSHEENLLACQAFVAASENSKKGNGQKREKFEDAIGTEFTTLVVNMTKKDPTFVLAGQRTGSSISQRFKTIRKVSLTFHGIVQSIYNSEPTGSPSESDVFNAATAVYNDLATVGDMYKYFGNSTLKVGKPFLFLNCYIWMKGTYLWKMILAANESATNKNKIESFKKGEIASSVSPEEDKVSNASGSTASERRPVGAKRAAAQMKQIAVLEKGAAGIAGLANESKKRNEISEKLFELEKRNSRISLFNIEGTSVCLREKFLQIEQNRVLFEMEAEQQANESAIKKLRTNNNNDTDETGAQLLESDVSNEAVTVENS